MDGRAVAQLSRNTVDSVQAGVWCEEGWRQAVVGLLVRGGCGLTLPVRTGSARLFTLSDKVMEFRISGIV